MKGDDIAERLLEFAVTVLQVTTRLPANVPGRHLASQLIAHSRFPVSCSPVLTDVRLTRMGVTAHPSRSTVLIATYS
jgi:hypothetical protein